MIFLAQTKCTYRCPWQCLHTEILVTQSSAWVLSLNSICTWPSASIVIIHTHRCTCNLVHVYVKAHNTFEELVCHLQVCNSFDNSYIFFSHWVEELIVYCVHCLTFLSPFLLLSNLNFSYSSACLAICLSILALESKWKYAQVEIHVRIRHPLSDNKIQYWRFGLLLAQNLSLW